MADNTFGDVIRDSHPVSSVRSRDEVVKAYREAGLGGERYGVVCRRCYKRICLQGWFFAMDNAPTYCLCRENYNGDENVDNITTVLETHGIDPRRAGQLQVRVKMTEATKKKQPTKKNMKKPIKEEEIDDDKLDQLVTRSERTEPTFAQLLASRAKPRPQT